MFTKACELNELREGKYEVVAVNRTLLIVVWPKDQQPKAFQGLCPHMHEPLADALFDGTNLTCRHHDWEFEGQNGACIKGQHCTLAEYPLKIEGDEVLIETDGVQPNFID